jgi:hypothetical protein
MRILYNTKGRGKEVMRRSRFEEKEQSREKV